MSSVGVYALIDGTDVRAGTLYAHRRRSAESATFTYDADYLAMPGAYGLDPALALRGGAHQTPVGRRMFGAFRDCAPDRWGRTILDRRGARLAREAGHAQVSLGEMDYLLGVRDDLRQGALRFRSPDGLFVAPSPDGVPALTDLPELLDLAARAEADAADLPDLQRLVKVGSSLGGARPKAHVRAAGGRIAIAKFPSANDATWNVMAWEKVALDLAAAGGIEVPVSELLDLAGRRVLVVDRFDRTENGGRVGYVSAMTMLEATDGDQRSYLEIADVVQSNSANTTAELHQLWRRIVFSILISNTDDHLRNHGFLHEGAGVWRLAPAFDLNPDPRPGLKFLSTAIDESDDTASVALALAVAGYFRLEPGEARRVLREVASAVAGWRHVARSHQLSGTEIDAMQSAFSGLAEVGRFLRSLGAIIHARDVAPGSLPMAGQTADDRQLVRGIRRLRRVRAAVAGTTGDPDLHPVAARLAARTLLLDGLIGRSTRVSGKQTSRLGLFGALLAMAAGIVLVFFTGLVSGPTRAFDGGAVERGRVVAVERFTDESGRTVCAATATYQVGGRGYSATTDYRSARSCDAMGVEVDVSYPPADPDAGRPLFETDRTLTALLPVAGWLLLIAGFVALLTRMAQIAASVRLRKIDGRAAGAELDERAYVLLREAWTGKPLPASKPVPAPEPAPEHEIDLRQETAGTTVH